jgi:E3 ubiquitin-protein ligase RNF14
VTILQSIYPDCVSLDSSNGILKFEIPVELEYPMDVFVTGNGTTETQEHHLSLSSLPPVLMEVVLPPTYPLSEAPRIASFHVSGSWIPHSGLLLEALMEMWQPGEGILCTWVEWIRGAAFLNAMHIIHDDVLR